MSGVLHRLTAVMVLHGWWSRRASPGHGGNLVLWGEDALRPVSSAQHPGRRPKVREHPFAVPAEALTAAIGLAEILGPGVHGDLSGFADLELPGFGHAPMASPELLDLRSITGTAPGEGETARLYPGVAWRVPIVSVGAVAAELVLWELCRRHELEPEAEPGGAPEGVVRIGSDLRQLFGLAGFAADLVRRGRVLPVALPGEPGRGVARWRPVLTGADADWFRAAVAALPASYRAGALSQHLDVAPSAVELGPDAADAGRDAAGASAAAAVDALADAAVRARIGPAVQIRSGQGAQTGLAGWRRALRGADPGFPASSRKLAELTRALSAWQSEATAAPGVRACFRLSEPTDDDEESVLQRPDAPSRSEAERARWHLEFGLQVLAEPSLIVWARQIWSQGEIPAALARQVPRPQEALLAELGRALRLYPMLGVALAGSRPAELSLDTEGAHDFLAQTAGLLVGAGFGVFLPGWWSKPASRRLGVRLRAGTPGQPGRVEGPPSIGQNHLVEFDWRLSVGDQTLSESEVDELIESRQSLVRLRGEWIQVDPDRLQKARDFLRRNNSRQDMTVGEVLRVLGSEAAAPGGLPVTGVDAAGWLADLLTPPADQRLSPVPVPAAFSGTLRPYQERGLAWLAFLDAAGLGAVLADDMGLGKTVQLLALIARDLDDVDPEGGGQDRHPTLLVCPMSLVGNWQREAARFTPKLRVHVHHGNERPRGAEFEAAVGGSDLVITTYALLARDAGALRAMPWRRVILDEAQAVKNAATQAAVAARSLTSGRRIAVTGTPVENRLADLWSLMEFANPKLLGDATDFKRRFALPIERLGDADASARLRALTQPFVLRRLKTDRSIITDLPEKLEMEVVCTLTAEQAALYQSVVDDMLERISNTDGMERRGLVLAAMTKLKQVCNHPAQFLRDGSRVGGRSGKLARLEETLEEVLAAGEKALLFTQFAEFGELLRTHLTSRFGREVLFLHGGTSKAQRDEMVARFQSASTGPARSGPPLFVLSLKAGGTGLTLTEANHVIHVDRWWNPAVEDQATDRAFRIGQSRAVQVRKFVCAGTLEEKIAAMITDKRGLAASVVGSGEGWLTELDTAQLRTLFTLDAGSVVA
jgi:non-specific serine/threonine protein kinase